MAFSALTLPDGKLLFVYCVHLKANGGNAVATGDRQQIVESAKRFSAPLPELLSVEQIAMKFNLCTRSIWRLVAKGDLPQPILIGSSRRWYAADIDAYLAKQTAKRDGINRRRGC